MTMTLRYVHRLLAASALSLLTMTGCAPTDDAPAPFAWAEAADSLTIVGEGTAMQALTDIYFAPL
jgi:hypothetical protein